MGCKLLLPIKPFYSAENVERLELGEQKLLEVAELLVQENAPLTFSTILDRYCQIYDRKECFDVENRPELFERLYNLYKKSYLIKDLEN